MVGTDGFERFREAYERPAESGKVRFRCRRQVDVREKIQCPPRGRGHALFFEVPFDVKKEFGKARPPVKVSVDGHSYRSTVSVYGGKYYLPVRRDHREAAGLKHGDIIQVAVALDAAARTVQPPPALSAALTRNSAAKTQWQTLSYTHKKEHADAIRRAKKPETRARRVQKTLEMLAAKAK